MNSMMNRMCIPVLNNKKFTLSEMYNEDYAIYLKESIITEPIILNKEAKTIFSYIDGKNSIDKIICFVMSDYNITQKERICNDVEKELEIFWGLKILDFVGQDPFQEALERDIGIYKISYIREIYQDEIDANSDYVYGFWDKGIDYTTTMLNASDEAGALKMFRLKKDEQLLMTFGVSYSFNTNIFEIKFIHIVDSEINNISKIIKQILTYVKDFYLGNSIDLQSDSGGCFLVYIDSLDNNGNNLLRKLSFVKCGQLKEELETSDIDVFLYCTD